MLRTIIDKINLNDVQMIISLVSVILSIIGSWLFSMSKNQAIRILTLIIIFVFFEGANIYFSITSLKPLPSQEELWWFSIGIIFTAVHLLCAVQNTKFHLVLIRHTFNETTPRLPNIQFKTQTQVILIVLLCFCGIAGFDDPIFFLLTTPVLILIVAGVKTLAIHQDECWLADILLRARNFITERPGININIMICVIFLVALPHYNFSKTTDNGTALKEFKSIHVPLDVLYNLKIDTSLIFRIYGILYARETFLCSVYETLLDERPPS